MITQVLFFASILPLYIILLGICWRFRYVQKIISYHEVFADTTETPEKGVVQHRKQECNKKKSAISKWKVQGDKKQWTHEKVYKVATKLSIKHMLNTSSENFIKRVKKMNSPRQACD